MCAETESRRTSGEMYRPLLFLPLYVLTLATPPAIMPHPWGHEDPNSFGGYTSTA